MRALIKLAGVTLGKRYVPVFVNQMRFYHIVQLTARQDLYDDRFRRQMRKELRKTKDKVKKPAFTMATTTKLVTQIFDSMFQGEIDDKSGQGSKRRRCGICEVRMLDVIDGIRMSVCRGKFKSIYKHVEYF